MAIDADEVLTKLSRMIRNVPCENHRGYERFGIINLLIGEDECDELADAILLLVVKARKQD